MPNNAHEQHLRELVAFPREDLNIELKGWLSPSDETDRANVAKALLALANTGGGYLLIGFDEHEDGWAAAPNEGSDDFSQDVINQIVARYADPRFHCAVYHVGSKPGEIMGEYTASAFPASTWVAHCCRYGGRGGELYFCKPPTWYTSPF